MKLIVGLGNPEVTYHNTRHNLGFMVIDELARRWGVHFETQSKFKCELLVTMKDTETILLAKPQTYMNNSGHTVQKLLQFYKVSVEDTWVVSDDIDLTFGTVRVRQGGSSGGHNGLKDIIEKVGENFVRVRCGIANSKNLHVPTESFVLQSFDDGEQEQLSAFITHIVDMIENSLQNGIMIETSQAE